MKKPRVVLTYIESGFGHIMAMQAIHNQLDKMYGDKIEIINSNIMKDDKDPVKVGFEQFLSGSTALTNKAPAFGIGIFILFEMIGRGAFMRFINRHLFKKATEATIDAFRKLEPDVLVVNHYYTAFVACELKKKYMPNLCVICPNPDNNVHVWWDNRVDLFINNNAYACDEAIRRRKFKKEAVRQVYFTSRDEIMNAKGNKEEYRTKYGINSDFTLCIANGAYAMKKSKAITNKLLKLKFPVNIILLTGKNEELYQYFINKAKSTSKNIHLMPIKFTPSAYELYGASDIFITKAGPNSVLDSLYMGTPVLIDFYAHPIEKGTANLFVRQLKCGIEVNKTRHIVKSVTFLYEHPEFVQELKDNIKKSIKKENDGAKQTADIIYGEALKKETR